MRVEFQGSLDEILAEMHEFIQNFDRKTIPFKEKAQGPEVPTLGEKKPQNLGASDCLFCGKSLDAGERARKMHERYCSMNPNKVRHPRLGLRTKTP